MSSRDAPLDQIIEAALLAAGEPLTLERLAGLFDEYLSPTKPALREALGRLGERHPADASALELIETASGWRLRVRQQFSPWVSRLWEERPQRYSRALLETLALVAYRQPVTRGDIEQVRGVTVSSSIMRTLVERGWVRVVGHRDVPGRPAVFATTRQFLDDFGLKTLEELPPVHELKGFEGLEQLEAELYDVPPSQTLPLPEDPDGEGDGGASADDAMSRMIHRIPQDPPPHRRNMITPGWRPPARGSTSPRSKRASANVCAVQKMRTGLAIRHPMTPPLPGPSMMTTLRKRNSY
ncbi:SMC-Scp complex subunit ScpB [Cobetia sp. ICG0124]|uniref:SMC-Scp complex subunit ScpB n=1 Tax=Cobetia sp. ICG0124 TaxID=2053669 RepID=UPI00196B1B58